MRQTEHLGYIPTKKQRLFHTSKADEVLFGGAAGGGKTAALAMEAAQRCLETPGLQAYLFRKSYRELKDTLVLQARRFLPSSVASYNGSEMCMDFANGSSMKFRHCFNDTDRFQYAGVEMHALFIDELTHFNQGVYDYLKTRLRARKELQIKPIVRCSANPGGIGHAWVKQRFIDIGAPYEMHAIQVHSKMLARARRERCSLFHRWRWITRILARTISLNWRTSPNRCGMRCYTADGMPLKGRYLTNGGMMLMVMKRAGSAM
ncbi:phage terminase large subunit [Eubacteriales bacterium OttesenSCG-928-N14]|nr:phage terminase large subunit [Eubacteriales bacterium OttesenSCG-928-N14]